MKSVSLCADLQAPPGAAETDKGWARPAVCGARDDNSFASLAAHPESNLKHSNDGQSAGIAQDPRRNFALRYLPEVAQDLDRLVDDLLFGGGTRAGQGQAGEQEGCS